MMKGVRSRRRRKEASLQIIKIKSENICFINHKFQLEQKNEKKNNPLFFFVVVVRVSF